MKKPPAVKTCAECGHDHKAVAAPEHPVSVMCFDCDCRDFRPTAAAPSEGRRVTPLLLSKRRAAAMLGIGRCSTLETLIAEGKIRTVSVDGRVRIPLAEVERVAAEGTDAPPPPRETRVQAARERAAKSEADALREMKF